MTLRSRLAPARPLAPSRRSRIAAAMIAAAGIISGAVSGITPVPTPVATAAAQSSLPGGIPGSSTGGGFLAHPGALTVSIPGRPVHYTVEVPGQGQRHYIAEVPLLFDPNRAYPVIFALSPRGNTAENFRGYSNLGWAAGNDAIIIYPSPIAESWEGPRYARTGYNQDVDFIRAIVHQVRGNYRVDNSRIYAAGFSNGGGLALTLACRAPEIFSAVAAVAGAHYLPAFDNCRGGVDTLLIHGTEDPIAPYFHDGDNGYGGRYLAARHAWRRMADANGCGTDFHSTGYANVGIHTFNGCRAVTRIHRVNGGGHEWPATTGQIVWDFFRHH